MLLKHSCLFEKATPKFFLDIKGKKPTHPVEIVCRVEEESENGTGNGRRGGGASSEGVLRRSCKKWAPDKLKLNLGFEQ